MIVSSLLPASSVLSSLWIASLWQGLVLAAFTLLLLRSLPDLSARLRYRVWLAGYAGCALLPLVEWLSTGRGSGGSAVPTASAPMLSPLFTIDNHWSLLAAGLWAVCSLIAIVRLVAGLWSVRSLIHAAVPFTADEMAPYAELLHLRCRGRVALYASDAIEAPVAIGLWSPAIVLPERLLEVLSDEQLQQIMRHECEHLERRDDWTLLLIASMRCVFPLHPALLWFERQLVATREMACDDAVLRWAAPRAYAMNLAQIAEAVIRRSPRVLPSLLAGHSHLGRRIEHILSGRKDTKGTGRGPLLSAAIALLAMCALLVQCPALVVFQPRTETASQAASSDRTHIQSGIVVPEDLSQARVTAAALHTPLHTQAGALKVRSHRPRMSQPAPRLLAAADDRLARRQQERPRVWAQPAALLVLWSDGPSGFSAALLFATQPCGDKTNGTEPSFFLLQI